MNELHDQVMVRELNYNSDDYRKELELRDEVLRKPLGMSLYNDNLEGDKNDTHIGAFLDERLVGVLILTRLSDTDVKMRQVAVAENMQSQKVGSKMVRFAEAHVKEKGYKSIVLNARKTAVAFYEKQGYSTISGEFQEINIPHYKMLKHMT